MQTRQIITLFFCLFSSAVLAQEKLGEFSLSGLEDDKATIVKYENQAILTIMTQVPGLKFESNLNSILEARQSDPSTWVLIVKPGRQILTIRAEGFVTKTTGTISLLNKRAYRLKITQSRAIPGTLSIKTKPDSANLRINGVLLNFKTPFRTENAQPDTYFVEIIKERFLPVEKTLVVKSNEVTEWEVELKLGVVRVQIDIADKIKDVGIVVDGSARGLAPHAIDLTPGRHRLLLQKVGYRYTEKIIEIPEGQEEMRLVEKLEKIKSPFYRSWWFLTGTATALAGGTYALLREPAVKPQPLPEAPDFP